VCFKGCSLESVGWQGSIRMGITILVRVGDGASPERNRREDSCALIRRGSVKFAVLQPMLLLAPPTDLLF
jgi:hypothetical protein